MNFKKKKKKKKKKVAYISEQRRFQCTCKTADNEIQSMHTRYSAVGSSATEAAVLLSCKYDPLGIIHTNEMICSRVLAVVLVPALSRCKCFCPTPDRDSATKNQTKKEELKIDSALVPKLPVFMFRCTCGDVKGEHQVGRRSIGGCARLGQTIIFSV